MTAGPVVLTAHPLQRVGAYALAVLAGNRDPAEVTEEGFEVAQRRMADDLAATRNLEDAKVPGGFWLGASYMLWPNSPVNPTARKNQSPEKREADIRAWRDYPQETIAAPCALCGRPGCGFYGKVDVPLGASTAYRNTTAPGHEGLPLCRGCLACFHALPYGCMLGGGRATAVHSWDEVFMRRTVRQQVRRTNRQSVGTLPGSGGAYSRETEALRRLRAYGDELGGDVDLYVFSNSNREQSLDVHSLAQPLAEWLREVMRDPQQDEAFGDLLRAHRTEKFSGSSILARNAFRDPRLIITRSVSYLHRQTAERGAPPSETAGLNRLCTSFSRKVLQVEERDMASIQELAERIAVLLAGQKPAIGTLKNYEYLHRDPPKLQGWLKRNGVAWLAYRGETGPLVTPDQWRLLFEPDAHGRFFQDLLFVSVLQGLAEKGFSSAAEADPAGKKGTEADPIFNDEETAE